MKTYSRLFLIVLSVMVAFSCSNLDNLTERVDDIESRVTALEKVAETINGNIAALQAIASGQAINSVEEKDGAYILTLSNGNTITLRQGSVGMGKAPLVSIDKDGYWMVDYQDGNGAVYITDDAGEKIVAVGQNGVSPVFGVSGDGYWTVSYDGGSSFLLVLDVNGEKVKAVAGSSAEDSYFAGVEYNDESLVLTLKNGEQYRVPVVGGFLCKINGVADEEVFRKGEKKTFSVERKGISSTIITTPKGWEAYLTNSVLSIQAPADVETKATLADTRTDVAVVAISEAGHIAIAKVRVKVDGSVSVYDPAASVALVEATVNSLKFNVTTENAVSWYWMLRKAGDAVPGATEIISEGTKGTENTVLVDGLMGQTEYVMYVLPCGDVSNGPIATFKARTSNYSSMYEAWEAGAEIKIGSQTYSKAKTGYTAQRVSGEQTLWTSVINQGKVFFLAEGAVASFGGGDLTESLIVVGDVPGTRPTILLKGQTGLTGADKDFAFKNVRVETVEGMKDSRFAYSVGAIGKMVLEDCSVDLKYPLLCRYDANGNMSGVEILDCDVCVNWASNNTVPIFVNTHSGGSSLGDFIVKNNVFWSKDGKKEFHLCSSPWGYKPTKFNAVVLENNTFYNVNNGLVTSGRQKSLIMVSTLDSFSMNGNIAYDTAPDSKTVSTRSHFTWMYSGAMTLDALKAVTTNSTSNLINIAEYCSLLVPNDKGSADWGYGLTNLIKWQTGNQIIDSWTNPFKSENVETGVFETTEEYKAYGAQRK